MLLLLLLMSSLEVVMKLTGKGRQAAVHRRTAAHRTHRRAKVATRASVMRREDGRHRVVVSEVGQLVVVMGVMVVSDAAIAAADRLKEGQQLRHRRHQRRGRRSSGQRRGRGRGRGGH